MGARPVVQSLLFQGSGGGTDPIRVRIRLAHPSSYRATLGTVAVDTDISHRVYFEGAWNHNAQKQIESAVADFEADRTEKNLFPDRPSWVCVAYDIGPSALFCAHRPHLSNVLSARTARALADSIRAAT
jgi:hypothetical protein